MLLKLFTFCLILINLVNGQTYRYGCPPAISRCSCSQSFNGNSEYRTVVQCNDIYGYAIDFRLDLQALNGYEIDELVINNYASFDVTLPDNTFKDTIITKISIMNSGNLLFVGSTTSFFDRLQDSLETLRVENVPNLRADDLSKMATSLATSTIFKKLILFYNRNLRFNNFDAFNTLTSIERIIIRSNSQEDTPFSANLSTFINLRFLDLSDNGLITFDITGSAPQLTTIFLHSNRIITFPATTTANLPALPLVNLSNNQLSCACNDILYILSNSTLALMFTGTCSTPDALRDKPFARTCITGDTNRRFISAQNFSDGDLLSS